MRNYIIIIISFLFLRNIYAQEYYHVTAKNGLNVRAKADVKSKKIAKIPFGVVIEKIATTNKELLVKDEGKLLKGNWVKIKYNNYNYLVSEEKERSQKEGFVFDAFIKPMKRNNLTIEIDSLTKEGFLQLKEKHPSKKKALKKITNLDSIKVRLKNRVLWQRFFKDYEGKLVERDDAIKTIITDNNQKLMLDPEDSDIGFSEGFSGYYPEVKILVLEGGHSSDVCYSIKFGGETETVGNPEYIIPTPKETYRLNGYFLGQECVSYFLEKKENGVFQFYTQLDLWQDYDICYFKQFYWISETQFIYSKISYDSETEKEFEIYYKGEIKL